MKAWLKGGIVIWGIYIVVVVISAISHLVSTPSLGAHGTGGYWIVILSGFPFISFYESIYGPVRAIVGPSGEFFPLIVFGILVSPIYFIIGSIIGFIVGKIKSRSN